MRFSFGRFNKGAPVDTAVEIVAKVIEKLRRLFSPATTDAPSAAPLSRFSSVEKPALKRGSAVRRDMFIAKIHLPTAKLR